MRNPTGGAVELMSCPGLNLQGIFIAGSGHKLFRVVARHLAVIQGAQVAGSSLLQRAVAYGQRLWKAQPGGGFSGLGNSPTILIFGLFGSG